jgi:hypothetical protein
MTVWLLPAVLAALAVHTAVNSRLLPRLSASTGDVDRASVLLPVRDEVDRVGACLTALLDQRGVSDLDIVILDDGSTDGTAEAVRAILAAYPSTANVRLLTGGSVPDGWLGKPYACHQLADAASSDVLVFVDADVVLAPDAVAAAVRRLGGFDLLSPYPRILTAGSGARLVQPLLPWSWLTFLPLRAMQRSRRASLAAAGGQFLVVTRAGYRRAGGHAAVRTAVLEDIELARAVKRSGGRIALADASRLADCRMYTSWPSLVAGYTKSLWASFGSPAAAAGVVGMLLLLNVAPLLLALVGVISGAWTWFWAGFLGYLLGVAGRLVSARVTGGRGWPDALAHPASVALFAWLVIRSYRRRHTATWKGRPVQVPSSSPDDADLPARDGPVS